MTDRRTGGLWLKTGSFQSHSHILLAAKTEFTAAVTRTHIGLHTIRIGTCALAAVSAERLLVLPIIKHPSPQLTLTVGASSIVSGGVAVDWPAE